MRLLVLILFASGLLPWAPRALAEDAEPAAAAWHLLLFGRDGAVWVRADGRAQRQDARYRWVRGGADLAPDGKTWLRARPQRGNGGVFLCAADGRVLRRLTRATDEARWAHAAADGQRFVYSSRIDGTWQIHLARVAREPVAGKQVTKDVADATQPALAPAGGRVAFLSVPKPKRFTKHAPGDLVLLDLANGTRTVLRKNAHFFALAWSPDGKRVAASTGEGLEIYDPVAAKLEKRLPWKSIHQGLYAHAAHRLCWRPDGKEIACRINFLGGRLAGPNGEFEALMGDRELFFLPLRGPPRWITLPEGVVFGPVRWAREKDLPAAR